MSELEANINKLETAIAEESRIWLFLSRSWLRLRKRWKHRTITLTPG